MSRSQGLTLVEVVLAFLLLAIVLVVMANSQILSARVTRDSRVASQATQLANDIVEEVQQVVYRDWTTYEACSSCDARPLYKGTLPSGYAFTATISQPTSAGDPSSFLNEGLLKLDVAVTGPSSLSFVSYLSCYDEQAGIDLVNKGKCPEPAGP